MARLEIWQEPPGMETGSPLPSVFAFPDGLLVAYVAHNPLFPGWDSGESIEHPGFAVYSAILSFEGVLNHRLGPPNEEGVREHPLFQLGLRPYGFFELFEDQSAYRKWIITFHDETLEVAAQSARVVNPQVDGEDTAAILSAYLQGRAELAAQPNLAIDTDVAQTTAQRRSLLR